MDILQVSHRYPPAYGGIENYAHRLTESLEGANDNVTVVTTDLGLGNRPSDPFPEAIYCETTMTLSRNPFSIPLYQRLRKAKYDLCHLHSPYLLPTLEAVHALPNDMPKVVTVHGFPAKDGLGSIIRNAAYRPFAQYIYDRVNTTIVLSESEKERLLDRYDVAPDTVSVIPNGIKPGACDVRPEEVESFQQEYGINPETPTVLAIGRLVPVKNPQILVQAIVEYLSDVDLDVILVGEGDQEYVDELKAMADDRFTFIHGPRRPVLLRAYHASDLLTLLSKTEGLSTVLLEAMNARLTVVTTAAGGVSDVVNHRENGWVVDSPPDPATVAEAIQYYCDRPEECQQIGERNRTYVREAFAWSDIADRIRTVYKQQCE